MMKRWKAGKRLVPLFVGLTFLLSACGREDLSALRPQGPVAQGQFDLMKLAITIMLSVLVIVFGIAAYVLIKFRRKPGDKEMPKQVEGNHLLEIIWTGIPLILVLVLAVATVQKVFAYGENYWEDKDAVRVKVTSHLFWWEFNYPDYDITTAQDLIIPTNKKIAFQLKTADVIHSFWVPSLGGKTDTNTEGTINTAWLEAEKEGVYLGKCAELCGPSHALMEFKVKAVSQESFDNWVAAIKQPVEPIQDPALAEVFKTQCLSCHAVGDQGGPMGPNLTGIGNRETVAGILINEEGSNKPFPGKPVKDNLIEWLTNPQEVKPGNHMPSPKEDLGLTDEEIEGIAEYLANVKLNY
ncbi:cytochrome c oxidase subunit II [Paenibacillus sp. FSL W8-0186]|uniref:Cytochrome c oxidase subunit 2 n=1 Tax=Paenibacillus woosongensis TaxID=307580 RepID=A0A7X3CPS8_9BACL|nr:cytochrome c oxidase subunit II [Paenibacillus woosongensis]MUG46482.1 cytochrome c oxidase subunit II [Paenibacillus woosongensis]